MIIPTLVLLIFCSLVTKEPIHGYRDLKNVVPTYVTADNKTGEPIEADTGKHRGSWDEEFKNVASGIQSTMTALGFLVGGIWVIFNFWTLGTANKARAELQVLEHTAIEQPVLQIDIQSEILPDSEQNRRLISVRLKVRNDGKRILQLWSSDLCVAKLKIGVSNLAIDAEAVITSARFITPEGNLEEMPARIYRPGQSRTIAFVVPTPSAGQFLVQASASYSGLEIQKGRLVESSDERLWAVEQFIISVPADEQNNRGARPNSVS